MSSDEAAIEKPVVTWAARHGWLVRKLQWAGRVGAPDRFFAKDGRIVLIEFKRPGGKPRPTQDRELARLIAAGVECHVVDSIDQGKEVLGGPE